MTFSFFSKHGQNGALSLLIDVGSASVGVALVENHEGKNPHIFATNRENITFQEKLSSTEFLRAMNQALERVLKVIQIKTKTTGTPAHLFCSISSPWFLLKSRHLTIDRKEAFLVTQPALEKILEEGVEMLQNELKDTLPAEDMRVVEKKIIQTKLNGYEIKNPYGQKASRVELTMTVGVSSKQVIERIERTVANFFHAAPIHFGAFPIAAFSVIRDIFPTEKSFLFLDITGEGTDVSLVNNDILMGTMAFPRGKNFFIREISAQFRIPHEVAASILNMFLGGTLDAKRQTQVKKLMNIIENDWLARFDKLLISLGATNRLPRRVFFMADADIAFLFETILRRANATHLSNGVFDVQYLDHLILGKFASFENEVVRDPFLLAEALLAAKVASQLKK